MDNRPIGVFDSGVGGLTAVRQMHALFPSEDIIYFGDTGRVPYGTRSPETIIQYAKQDVRFLLSKDVKFLIAACGTISSLLPKEWTDTLPVPYTGVLDAAAAAAVKATRSGRIGVLGTPATIQSGSYQKRLLALRPDLEIHSAACPLFVPLVENGYVSPDDPVTSTVAEEYLAPLRDVGVDTLILGCTHYPLISGTIDRVMRGSAVLIDPGKETVLAAEKSLQAAGLSAAPDHKGCSEYYVSDLPENFESALCHFLQPDHIAAAARIDIENY